MIDDVFEIPGTRLPVENLTLAILVQAARDLAIPSACPYAMEWFLSDEYHAYTKAFGVDSDALLRALICNRYQLWKNWKRAVKTFQIIEWQVNEKRVLGIGALMKNHQMAVVCCPDRIYNYQDMDELNRDLCGRGAAIEWTVERRS